MKTYKSRQNPKILVTSDGVVDPKFKTVFVTYSDGKTKLISSSTFHTQWEEIETPKNKAIPLF
jgi:hypothetical protein